MRVLPGIKQSRTPRFRLKDMNGHFNRSKIGPIKISMPPWHYIRCMAMECRWVATYDWLLNLFQIPKSFCKREGMKVDHAYLVGFPKTSDAIGSSIDLKMFL
jgi:hypothetical protein